MRPTGQPLNLLVLGVALWFKFAGAVGVIKSIAPKPVVTGHILSDTVVIRRTIARPQPVERLIRPIKRPIGLKKKYSEIESSTKEEIVHAKPVLRSMHCHVCGTLVTIVQSMPSVQHRYYSLRRHYYGDFRT